ncbi:MAG: hypothetical protein WCJ35_06110 [Planctomycetota bacterium]
MKTRWYRLAVLALWLTAMSWLAIRKIMPPFFSGEPPIYESADADKHPPPVAWCLFLNEHRLGWALSEICQQSTDTTEIHSLVHFDHLPLNELLPVYLRAIARAGTDAAGSMEMEVESNLITNSALNQLISFYSKFRPKSGPSLVKIEGNVEGDKLKLSVRVGNYDNPNIELPMPDSKIRDSFAPEMELRGLHLGQSWTIVSYSPLALPSHSMDMIQGRTPTEVLFARVEEQARMEWNGQLEPMWVVVYRTDAREGPGSDKNIRNRLWVRRAGTVLRQEVLLGDHSLLFTRMPEKDATKLRDAHQEFPRHQPAAQP